MASGGAHDGSDGGLESAFTHNAAVAFVRSQGEACSSAITMPFPACGRVAAAGDGFRWRPLTALDGA